LIGIPRIFYSNTFDKIDIFAFIVLTVIVRVFDVGMSFGKVESSLKIYIQHCVGHAMQWECCRDVWMRWRASVSQYIVKNWLTASDSVSLRIFDRKPTDSPCSLLRHILHAVRTIEKAETKCTYKILTEFLQVKNMPENVFQK